ncbi:MAG: hypothetical protein JST09_06095 [Bacteroidetes bacterium]|nr:hypothetical protein [Bacteroidota bacterium]
MKKLTLAAYTFLLVFSASAQIGIGTTSPNSTLDVRGSLSMVYKTFSANTSATIADNFLVFTGTSAATLTLPSATTCADREYWVKNASFSINDATTFIYTTTELVTVTLAEVNANAANTILIGFTNSEGTARAVGPVTFDATIIQ